MDEDDTTGHSLVLPSTSLAPRLARRHLATVGADWPDDLRDLAILLTSELVTNAVRYGHGTVGLTVEESRGRIRIGVADANPAPARSPGRADPTAERGRGLGILDSLAARWGCTAAPGTGGKTVWFDLDRDPASVGRATDQPVPPWPDTGVGDGRPRPGGRRATAAGGAAASGTGPGAGADLRGVPDRPAPGRG